MSPLTFAALYGTIVADVSNPAHRWREQMATAIEYGLIAAGISVAIIVTVQGLGSKLSSTLSPASTRYEPAPSPKPLKPSVTEMGWRNIIAEHETSQPDVRAVTFSIDWAWPEVRAAFYSCSNPHIDREKNRAYIYQQNGGKGANGYLVLCRQ